MHYILDSYHTKHSEHLYKLYFLSIFPPLLQDVVDIGPIIAASGSEG